MRVENPQNYFNIEKKKLEELVSVVRKSFGRENMKYDDIYSHIISPNKLFLIEVNSEVRGMAGYSNLRLAGEESLMVDGIALSPELQGHKLFSKITSIAQENEKFICLRTQNPRMYSALREYCLEVYPNLMGTPERIISLREDLAKKLNCIIDENGIVRRYYGGLFYGEEPKHPEITSFFRNNLGLDIHLGDALLCVGITK